MLVEQWMERTFHTVAPETTVLEALEITRQKRVRHVLVVEDGELVGIVSDRDLRDVKPSILSPENYEILTTTRIKQIMKSPVFTVHPLDSLEEAAREMVDQQISCLPVVQSTGIVGVLTVFDIMSSLVHLMGFTRAGSHLELEIPDEPDAFCTVASIVKNEGLRISALYISPGQEGKSDMSMRVDTIDPRKLVKALAAAGFRVKFPALGGI